jgi:hypothetical protein
MIVLMLSEKVECSLHLPPKRKHKKFGGLEIVIPGNFDFGGGRGKSFAEFFRGNGGPAMVGFRDEFK